jgi:hypothetical protein
MVKEMDENEKNVPEEKKPSSPDKKQLLDLSQAMTTHSDDDDDIIELKDEIPFPPNKEASEIDLSEPSTAESSEDEPSEETGLDLRAFDMETAELEDDLRQLDELPFEEEDESPEDERLEEERVEDESLEDESLDVEEIQPLVTETPAETSGSDDVIEITEFDDILSEDVNEMVTLTDAGEVLDSEEEFLELIDVEEDSLPEEADDIHAEIEDEIIQFDGLKAEVEDVELEDFINDSLNEEIRIDDDIEDELTNSLGVEAGSEMRMSDETPEEEDLDFNIDSKEMAERIDQVETIFFDETRSHADLADEPPSDAGLFEDIVSDTASPEPEIEDENMPLSDVDIPEELPAATGLANLAPEQIEESIDRVIQQNFSKKIESMVAEAIEKAVSKEIDRLKNILMDDDSNERS